MTSRKGPQPPTPPGESDDAREPVDAGPPPEVAADEVDEASWESFPASDSPGWRQHD